MRTARAERRSNLRASRSRVKVTWDAAVPCDLLQHNKFCAIVQHQLAQITSTIPEVRQGKMTMIIETDFASHAMAQHQKTVVHERKTTLTRGFCHSASAHIPKGRACLSVERTQHSPAVCTNEIQMQTEQTCASSSHLLIFAAE